MKSYRLQNFLQISIETNEIARFEEYFDNEYSRIANTSEHEDPPRTQITLYIVKTLPHPKTNTITRSESFKGLFQYNFSIEELDSDHIKVYFQYHPISSIYTTAAGVFLQAQVLEPIMYLALLRQKVLLMHSAGIAKEDRSYIFPAHGGTGKTTTCISLLSKGFTLLGDDLVLIDSKNSRAYPYPRPLHLFTYNINALKNAQLPLSLTFFVRLKNILRFFLEKFLGTEFLISTRIHADQIFPNLRLSSSASLHVILFLTKEGDNTLVNLSEENIAEHALRIIESADLNESLYRLLSEIQSDAVKKAETELATDILRNTHRFGYLNTRTTDIEDIGQYLDHADS